ncbi:MAG: hypothetical protein ACO39C_04455 [Chthoniobacterales bacterium]
MKIRTALPLFLAASQTWAVAQTVPAIPADAKDAMAAFSKMLQSFGDDSNNPLAALGAQKPVGAGELKAMLPADADGLRRTNARGEITGAFGANVVQATGEYGDGEGPRVKINITDLAAMGPFGALAGFGWMQTEVDSEGDHGYERTTEQSGFKTLEKYTNASRSGTITVVVGNRFIVEVEGRNIDPTKLQACARAIDFSALDNLAKAQPATE